MVNTVPYHNFWNLIRITSYLFSYQYDNSTLILIRQQIHNILCIINIMCEALQI